jgi:hypothetical protein
MNIQREQIKMATPAEVLQRRNFNNLDRLTALSARFDAQRIFGALANRSCPWTARLLHVALVQP